MDLLGMMRQYRQIRACCQAMVRGSQLLLWREDGFHLRTVALRSAPLHPPVAIHLTPPRSPDLQLVLFWEDGGASDPSPEAGRGGVRVDAVVDVLPSALSARLQTRTALSLSLSIITRDGCYDLLALSQEEWTIWYTGLQFLAETSEPQLQPLDPAGARIAVERRPSSSESERSDAPPGMGVNKTQESSAQSDQHLAVRERVMLLQRLASLHELVEAKDKSIAALSHLLATSVS